MSQGSGERLLSILDMFTEDQPEWTPQELMGRLGCSRPTLYRYLKVLREAGFLAPVSGGAFGLGPRFVEMDFLARKSDPLVAYGQPHLNALAAQFPGTAFLVRWYGERMLCVASASRDAAARTSYPRGRPMPLANGAAAKAILAHLPRRRLEIVADGADLAETLRTIRRDGIAVAHGEVTPGIVGTAAPVFDATGNPLASLCVSMEADAYAATSRKTLEAAILAATQDISTALSEPVPEIVGELP
ncbi:helix-turn-helix domain-containing protein [Rhodobacterales bacterium HKCCE4037]|nr:helix-turn-helix domain-containing protein [Rhodobacterales bacterium HKCCE4037]